MGFGSSRLEVCPERLRTFPSPIKRFLYGSSDIVMRMRAACLRLHGPLIRVEG